MHRIRTRNAVLAGAVIGLVAGAATYGIVSSSAVIAPAARFRPAPVAMTVAPARTAGCAPAQTLRDGVCIVHVVRVVVLPAPVPSTSAVVASAPAPAGATPAAAAIRTRGADDAGEPGDGGRG
jgi:hypothetical protein